MGFDELKNINYVLKFITHDKIFHADDVFAYAVLNKLFPKNALIRTRNFDIINNGDIVFDVGKIYNYNTNRFDHHQSDFNLVRGKYNIPYSSFGLVWNKFGIEYCKLFDNDDNIDLKQLFTKVDERIVQPIDAVDNGIMLSTSKNQGLHPIELSGIISSFNPTWYEPNHYNKKFIEASEIAKTILDNTIKSIYGKLLSYTTIENKIRYAYDRDQEYIYLDKFMPWQEAMLTSAISNNIKFVLFKDSENDYRIATVPIEFNSFSAKKELPKEWGGKSPNELNNIIGIDDAIFCHKGLFIAGAKSKESILKMVELALEN